MKQLTILMMIILLFGGVLVSCEETDDDDDVVIVDPCEETPNCIPELSDWKLHYKPQHDHCTQCHTGCLPKHETFCSVDDMWAVQAEACMRCHRRMHK